MAFKRRQAGWFLEKTDFKAAQCSDALHSELAPNKEEANTFTWVVDNFEEKCPPKGKTGNVPPGAEAPHNPRLCLPTAPWTDLSPAPPPGFLHPAEAAGRAAPGPPPTARLQPSRTPAAAGNRPRAPGFPGSAPGAFTVEVAAVRVSIRVLRAQSRSPDGGGGGSERPGPSPERAARPWAADTASAASVAARPARFGPARIRNPRAPRGRPLLLGVARRAAPPRGETRVRASFPGLRIPEAGEFCLGPYEHLSASSSPSPWARARTLTHTHSHSPARVRTAARPEPRNLRRRYSHGLPAATGRPLSAAAAAEAAARKAAAARPGLRARRTGQSPGEKRVRRARRREGAAPRPLLVPRPQVRLSALSFKKLVPTREPACFFS
ncbi:translation initiation factor IF-2-like [Cervus elaphus]|uniref:translation initiation factor IF-2-like n=1 Tax=Cervus elaphus TaxID=9860 RepID=UPI001CC2D9D6|nr:translation initiation factor IF-2-like [Cervus elaphus]